MASKQNRPEASKPSTPLARLPAGGAGVDESHRVADLPGTGDDPTWYKQSAAAMTMWVFSPLGWPSSRISARFVE